MVEDFVQAVKWLALFGVLIVVALVVGAFLAGRASVTALDVRRDSLRSALAARIDTVTVYVDRANRAKVRSDASKTASDASDAAVTVIDTMTVAIRVTPAAPPVLYPIPPEMIAAHLNLRRTVADQATTILDTRAALSHAQGALGTAVSLHAADSTRIAQLQRRQCDTKCKVTLLSLGALLGAIAAR